MNVQTLTELTQLNLVLKQRPCNDQMNNEKVRTIRDTGSVGEDCTEDAADSQNENAINSNPTMTDKDIIRSKTKGGSGTVVSDNDIENVRRSVPPTLGVEREKIPCLPSKSKTCQSNARQVKRNKNEHPGTVACQSATDNAKVALLTSQVSVPDIDGPEVELDSPVSGIPSSVNSIPSGTTPSSSVSMASSTSSVSLASSASSPVDDLEYGDFSASSMPSSCSQSSLCDKTRSANTKDDLIILHTEEDEEDAYGYKKHLESDIGIPDIKVQLFSSFGYGRSDFASLQCLGDSFHHTLVYVTHNLLKCYNTKFLNEILIQYNLENGPNCKVTPIWTTKEKQQIPELKALKGLDFWRFKEGSLAEIYIDNVKKLVEQVRRFDISI